MKKNAQLKAIIENNVKRLKLLRSGSAKSKWEEAMILYEMRKIPWKLTEYKTWRKFTILGLDQHEASTSTKVVAYAKALSLGYSFDDLLSLSETFSFSTLRFFLAKQTKKIAVRSLKAKYTNRTMYESIKGQPSVKSNMGNHFAFVLTDHNAATLEGILSQYGMHKTPEGRKVGVSDAMDSFLETYEFEGVK